MWECDPAGKRTAVRRPAMGCFKHEAAAVDPRGRRIYLTEDLMDGRLYRFTPARWHDLSDGLLEVATVARDGRVTWTEVPDPSARHVDTRKQVRGSSRFKRAEGIWHDDGLVYIATTGDDRVYAYDTRRERIEVIYDGLGEGYTPLMRVDQLTANRAGEVFVCEDIATDEIDIGLIDRQGPGVEVPVGDRADSRRVRADGRDLRPVREPDVLLVTAGVRKERRSTGTGRHLRGVRALQGG